MKVGGGGIWGSAQGSSLATRGGPLRLPGPHGWKTHIWAFRYLWLFLAGSIAEGHMRWGLCPIALCLLGALVWSGSAIHLASSCWALQVLGT